MEKVIIEQCARQRLPLPPRIANAPDLFFGLGLYYVAFMDLTTCRGTGYGTEGPISWLAMNEYARAKGLGDEQREDLFFYVGRMDLIYLNHKTKKIKDASKGGLVGPDGRAMR